MKVLSYSPLIRRIVVTPTNPEKKMSVDFTYKLGKCQPTSADSPGARILRYHGAHIFSLDLPHKNNVAKEVIRRAIKGLDLGNGLTAYAWFATSALKRDTLILTTVKLPGWFEACHNDVIRFGTLMAPCNMGVREFKSSILIVDEGDYGTGDGQGVDNTALAGFEQQQFRMAVSFLVDNENKFFTPKGTKIPGNMHMPTMPGCAQSPVVSNHNVDFVMPASICKPKGRVEVGDVIEGQIILGVIGEGQGSVSKKENYQFWAAIHDGTGNVEKARRSVYPELIKRNLQTISSVRDLAKRFHGSPTRDANGAVSSNGVLGMAYDLALAANDDTILYTPYFLELLMGEVNQENRNFVLSCGVRNNRLRNLALPVGSIERGIVVMNTSKAIEFGVLNAEHDSMAPVIILRDPHVKQADSFAGYVLFKDDFPEKSIGMLADDAKCMGADYDGDDLNLTFPWTSINRWEMARWEHYRKVMVKTPTKGRATREEAKSLEEAMWTVKNGKVGRPANCALWLDTASRMSKAEWDKVKDYLKNAGVKNGYLTFSQWYKDWEYFRDNPDTRKKLFFPPTYNKELHDELIDIVADQIARAVDSAKQMSKVDNELTGWIMKFIQQCLKVGGYSDGLGWKDLFNDKPWMRDQRTGKMTDISQRLNSPHPLAKAWADLGTQLKPLGAISVSAKKIQRWMPDGIGQAADIMQEIFEDHTRRINEVSDEMRTIKSVKSCLEAGLPIIEWQPWMLQYLGVSLAVAKQAIAGEIEIDTSWLDSREDDLFEMYKDVYQQSISQVNLLFSSIKDDKKSTREAINKFWYMSHDNERSKAKLLWSTVPELAFNQLVDYMLDPKMDWTSTECGIEQNFVMVVPAGRTPGKERYSALVSTQINERNVKQQTKLLLDGKVEVLVRENTPIVAKDGDILQIKVVKQLTKSTYACVVAPKMMNRSVSNLNKIKLEKAEESWSEISFIFEEKTDVWDNLEERSLISTNLAPFVIKQAEKEARLAAKAQEMEIEDNLPPILDDFEFSNEIPQEEISEEEREMLQSAEIPYDVL